MFCNAESAYHNFLTWQEVVKCQECQSEFRTKPRKKRLQEIIKIIKELRK